MDFIVVHQLPRFGWGGCAPALFKILENLKMATTLSVTTMYRVDPDSGEMQECTCGQAQVEQWKKGGWFPRKDQAEKAASESKTEGGGAPKAPAKPDAKPAAKAGEGAK